MAVVASGWRIEVGGQPLRNAGTYIYPQITQIMGKRPKIGKG
jgi:hypothetical protein